MRRPVPADSAIFWRTLWREAALYSLFKCGFVVTVFSGSTRTLIVLIVRVFAD